MLLTANSITNQVSLYLIKWMIRSLCFLMSNNFFEKMDKLIVKMRATFC